jgi:hypothetical protein
MPQVLGPAGNPPEATRNEVLLREAVDRLRAQLDAAREVVAFTRDALPEIWVGDTRARGRAVLAAYDKIVKELTAP